MEICPCCSRYLYFISFYGWIIFCCIVTSHSVYSFVTDRHLGCCLHLAIMNNTAMNIHVLLSMWLYDFISLGYILIPKSGIAGTYGNSMFNHLRNYQIVFKSGCTRTSLVVQFLRLHLLTQGVLVWSLVRELRPHTTCNQKTKT